MYIVLYLTEGKLTNGNECNWRTVYREEAMEQRVAFVSPSVRNVSSRAAPRAWPHGSPSFAGRTDLGAWLKTMQYITTRLMKIKRSINNVIFLMFRCIQL